MTAPPAPPPLHQEERGARGLSSLTAVWLWLGRVGDADGHPRGLVPAGPAVLLRCVLPAVTASLSTVSVQGPGTQSLLAGCLETEACPRMVPETWPMKAGADAGGGLVLSSPGDRPAPPLVPNAGCLSALGTCLYRQDGTTPTPPPWVHSHARRGSHREDGSGRRNRTKPRRSGGGLAWAGGQQACLVNGVLWVTMRAGLKPSCSLSIWGRVPELDPGGPWGPQALFV